ncbi:MAG: hypothetical protein J2P17_20855 [Mycobacterium sp.]|nr:hypothetical protein [Mycobacterium sp.]
MSDSRHGLVFRPVAREYRQPAVFAQVDALSDWWLTWQEPGVGVGRGGLVNVGSNARQFAVIGSTRRSVLASVGHFP